MKNQNPIRFTSLSLVVVSLAWTSVSFAAGNSCDDAVLPMAKTVLARQAQFKSWRVNPNKKETSDYYSLTNPTKSGRIVRTNDAREREMKDYALDAKKEVYIKDIQAYGIHIQPEVGTKMTYLEDPGAYGSHQTQLIKISNIGPDGIFRATLGLPVSGRFGQEQTMKWATTDIYQVLYKDVNDQQSVLIEAPSRSIVTWQEIEIPLVKDQVVTILYNRLGSAGPYGFEEGRIVRITWDGK